MSRRRTPRRTCLVIANAGDDDAGLVGEALVAQGFALSTLHREELAAPSDAVRGAPAATDSSLIVALGSDWSVYWPELAVHVEAEAELLRRAHFAHIPILGICFGGQMLAHALGGAVGPAAHYELGWCPVTAEPEAPHWLRGPWFQWHVDAFAAPPGAAVLARSPAGIQATRIGRSLAVQFHPEVTPAIASRWATPEALTPFGATRAELLDDGAWTGAPGRAEAFVAGFLNEVAQLGDVA